MAVYMALLILITGTVALAQSKNCSKLLLEIIFKINSLENEWQNLKTSASSLAASIKNSNPILDKFSIWFFNILKLMVAGIIILTYNLISGHFCTLKWERKEARKLFKWQKEAEFKFQGQILNLIEAEAFQKARLPERRRYID